MSYNSVRSMMFKTFGACEEAVFELLVIRWSSMPIRSAS